MTLEESDYTLLGLAIVAAQKVEFVLYGIASHLPHVSKDTKFRKLTASDFLSTDPKTRKLRKATLGSLAGEYGGKLMLPSHRLEVYVQDRNTIVHEFWREVVGGKGTGAIKEPRQLLIGFIEESEEWIAALRGLLSFLQEEAAKRRKGSAEYKLTEADKKYRESYLEFVSQTFALTPDPAA